MANVDHLLPRVGERIGSYQLVQELARGGFSVVFRALQVPLNADVAVKFLAPPSLSAFGSQQLLQRFQQEARVAQRLQHPCAIKVRDYGRTPNGLMYLVTDFIDGRVLSDVIAERPLSVARTVRIASQVLGCLGEAHGLGIVHRDLKPDNIMLRDFHSEKDLVTVLDFGVAKVAESFDGVVTQVGMTLGTPYYTAPEQCRGEKHLDGRADLYSLGLILAECLTGRRVVGTDNAMAAVYIQAGAQPLEFEPALHSSPLFPVIQRATQKPRDWRYADAARMREAVELAAGYRQPVPTLGTTRPIHQSAVHDAVQSGWSTPAPSPPTAGTPVGGSPAHWTQGAGATASPHWASSPAPSPLSAAVARPRRRRNLTWLWVTALVLGAGAIVLLLVLVLDRALHEEPASEVRERPAASESASPHAAAVPAPPATAPREEPRGRSPVRATVQGVYNEGSERRVTLEGCGLSSGIAVGERATIGDTGIELEITRLRDDSHCTARTTATASELDGITEVVFRARPADPD